MSVPSNEARALIVDARPLRRLGIAAVFYGLFESNRCPITSISSPMEAEALIAGSVTFQSDYLQCSGRIGWRLQAP